MVLGVAFEEDWEDFRFMATGLFLALAWNTGFGFLAFGAASARGMIVSSLLALCSVDDDSKLLGENISLSDLVAEGRAAGRSFVELAERSFA